MSSADPFWGAPRVLGALSKIGIDITKSTVEKDMVRRHKPPSPTWRIRVLGKNYEFTFDPRDSGRQHAGGVIWKRETEIDKAERVRFVTDVARYESLEKLAKHSPAAAKMAELVKEKYAAFVSAPEIPAAKE